MLSDKLLLVVVVLAAVFLSTAVAYPLTDCSSSTWSSNYAASYDRESYSPEDYVGAGVGGSGLREKGCLRRELVLSKPLRLALRLLACVTMPNWSPKLFFVASQDWLALASHSSKKSSSKRPI